MKKFFLLVFAVVILSGCAIGNQYSYHNVIADINVAGNKTIGVATHDQREYVISGRKNPDFIGLQRGGYGNPFNVSTESGRSLAEDMTDTIAVSLSKKGFKCIPVIVSYSDSANAVMEKIKATSSDALIVLTLNEWKSDTATNVALIYDVNLKIYDKTGTFLAGNSLKGKDNLKGSFWNPPAYAKKAVPEAFKRKVEELFNNPDIAKSLQ